MKSLDKRDQSQALSSLRTASRFESSQSMIRVWVIFIEWVKVNMFFTIKIVSTWSLIIWKICLSVWHFHICWLKQKVIYFDFILKSGKNFRKNEISQKYIEKLRFLPGSFQITFRATKNIMNRHLWGIYLKQNFTRFLVDSCYFALSIILWMKNANKVNPLEI